MVGRNLIKKIGLAIFMLELPMWLSAGGVKSDPTACPVTKIVMPDEIKAGHDADVLMKMAGKATGLKWETGIEAETVRFLFNGKAGLKRLQLSIALGEGTDNAISVQFQWIPKDKWWGQIIGELEIVPDGSTNCYFLEAQTLIPESSDAKEFILFFPAGTTVTSLRFSDHPSEKPL